MTPEVSVIVPTFNRREMVVEAVASVLAQRDVRFELIVVDDGSSDGSADAIEEAIEDSLAPVRMIQTENRGAAAARNLGVEAATAPLIAFLDSDDLWAPEKLKRQLVHLRTHPECEISQCNELWIRNGRRVNPGLRHRKHAGDIFIESLRTCLISPSAVIMRADLFRNQGGFDETMTAAEDYDLWLRILLTREIGLLDENLVTRRAGHGGQLSATVPAIDRFRILALTRLLTNPVLGGARRIATAQVLAEKCRIYAKGLARRGQDSEFYESAAASALKDWTLRSDAALDGAVSSIRASLLTDGISSALPRREVASSKKVSR
jgi:glycosyltransferase involved in cell wall biosynthesis